MNKTIRRIPIRESLTTRVLIAGCERFPLFLIFVFSGFPLLLSFILNSISVVIIIISLVIGVIGFAIAKYISRKDPYMFAIIWRHISYKSFYPSYEGYPGRKSYKFWHSPIKTLESKSVIQ